MLIEHLNRRQRERDVQALRRMRRIAESPCAPRQRISIAGAPPRELLAFCSNDYLGLANHPVLIEAVADGARRYGAGSGASHLISGHSRAHQALEDELAAWFAPFIPGAQALGFGTGYLANLALLTALGGTEATIFADKLNHASLVDGARLASAGPQAGAMARARGAAAGDPGGAAATATATAPPTGAQLLTDGLPRQADEIERWLAARTAPAARGSGSGAASGGSAQANFKRFAHGRLDVLERELSACTTPIRLIVVDAVFSMDGDLADVPKLLTLAERHDAWIVLDDAHGFGVLGNDRAPGRGTLAHFDLHSERIIVMGTLGKAAGIGGAFVAAHPAVIDALVQTARPYIYTTAAPPAIAHAALASLGLISGAEGGQRRTQLGVLIAALRHQLATLIDAHPALGWHLADSFTPIQPLIVGDNTTALTLSAALETRGLWVPAIRPPTVPAGSARLRITLSAAHTLDDVARLVDGLAAAAHGLAPAGERP